MDIEQAIRIAVTTGNNQKSTRDISSGFLRYAAERRPGWNIRFFPGSATATRDAWRRNVSPWKPDCVAFVSIQWMKFLPPLPRTCKLAAVSSGIAESDRVLPGRTRLVGIDDAAVARAAAALLMRRGLTHFAFVHADSPVEKARSRMRGAAFAACVGDCGYDCVECGLSGDAQSGDWTERLSALTREISALPKPCGVMAYSDNVARLVIDACNYALVSIPKQVQIVGVDNQDDICLNVRPRLTSVEPDFEGVGYELARQVDEMFGPGGARVPSTGETVRPLRPASGQAPGTVLLGMRTLVERETTLDLSGAARLATAAERIIEESACGGIGGESPRGLTPGALAKALHVSRRLLELRFREVRGEGVAAAIRRRKLDEVRRLLRETDQPIGEICAICGFPVQTHLNALFRQAVGCTPGEWRRREASG